MKVASDFGCEEVVDNLCAWKNLQCQSSFYLWMLECGSGRIAHLSHFEALK